MEVHVWYRAHFFFFLAKEKFWLHAFLIRTFHDLEIGVKAINKLLLQLHLGDNFYTYHIRPSKIKKSKVPTVDFEDEKRVFDETENCTTTSGLSAYWCIFFPIDLF